MKKYLLLCASLLLLLMAGFAQTPGPSLFDKSLCFDGSNDYATLSANPVAGMSGDYTIEFFMKLNNMNNWQRVFDFGNNTASEYIFFSPKSSSTGNPTFGVHPQGIPFTSPLTAGQWYHIAIVYDAASTTGKAYVNGTLNATNTSLTKKLSDAGSLTKNYLGKSQFSVDPYLNGNIEEFRISDIKRYTSNFIVPTSGFVADANTRLLYHFNESAGSQLFMDASSNAINALAGSSNAVESIDPTICDYAVVLPPQAVVSNIAAAEYFFDTDPGFKNGTPIPLSPSELVTLNFSPNISALSTGLHRMFVRTWSNDNRWSLSIPRLLYKEAIVNNTTSPITRAEYFFDADPGFGNANNAAITPGNTVSFPITHDISSLSNGLHRLYVRTRSSDGRWSHSISRMFYKEAVAAAQSSSIVKAEYFLNADPGFGNGTDIPVTPGQSVTFAVNQDISSLADGLHRLSVRTKDIHGRWSLTSSNIFYKLGVTNNTIADITGAEYFIDTDPGFGAATDIALTPGTDITFNFNSNITSLSDGLHRLFVRTRDANGKWSLTSTLIFYKQGAVNNPLPNITKAEYFFDTDPGFGSATNIPVTAGANITFSFNGSINALSDGLHRLFVRVWDETAARWSITNTQIFYKQAAVSNPVDNITKAEYFFDTDPGFGNATDVPVSPGQNITFNFNGDMSALADGLHRLYVRTWANNKWSLSNSLIFYKQAVANNALLNVDKLEYFFDTDPGFGNGTDVPITSAQSITISFNGDIASLPTGFHRMYVRARQTNGNWSITNTVSFYSTAPVYVSNAKINKAEYFFNTDPGFGNGVDVPVTPAQTVNLTIVPDISSLPVGFFYFYMRMRDENGRWSLTAKELLYKEAAISTPLSTVVGAEYFFNEDPGFGNGIPLTTAGGAAISISGTTDLSALPDGINQFYVRTRDANGKWSITATQMFYKEPVITQPGAGNITEIEWFIDEDPGFGNGTPIQVSTPAQGISISNLSLPLNLSEGMHRFYVRSRQSTGKWSHTTEQLFYYEVPVTQPTVGAITRVEWFWDEDPGFGNGNSVTIPSGQTQLTGLAFTVPLPANTQVNHVFYIRALDDWSLTTVVPLSFAVLPLTLLNFTAEAQPDKTVMTKWNTANEENTSHFDVEHSIDGQNFTRFGVVQANNTSGQHSYKLPHLHPVTGFNYYRLKQVDNDGAFTYSPVVKILFTGTNDITIAPNPFTTQFTIKATQGLFAEGLSMQLYDAKGAMVMRRQLTGISTVINAPTLTAGNYTLVIVNKNGKMVYTRILRKQ